MSYFNHFWRRGTEVQTLHLHNLLSSKLCFGLTFKFSHIHEVDTRKTEERKFRPTFPLTWVQVYTCTDHMGRVTTLHLAGHQHLSHLPFLQDSCYALLKRVQTSYLAKTDDRDFRQPRRPTHTYQKVSSG